MLEKKANLDMPSFDSDPQQESAESVKSFIWETVKIIVISLIIIVPIRYYVIQPFYVQGASMEPNFYDHEYLIIDEISYRFNDPQRGDIVVFKPPTKPNDFFIKRIVGMPEEKIVIEDGQVKIFNLDSPGGFILNEDEYLSDDTRTKGNEEIILTADEYYVLGDNRTSSLDSRNFGPITRDGIVGKTWLRGWPFNRFKVFQRPAYPNKYE